MRGQLLGSWGTYEVWLDMAETTLPDPAFEPYLYNSQEYLATQRTQDRFSVWLRDIRSGQTLALLRGGFDAFEASSPSNAPFGGLQYHHSVPAEVLMYTLDCLENWCRQRRIARLIIKSPPAGYNDEHHLMLKDVYEARGFSQVHSHTNRHIVVSPAAYLHQISAAERRRLRKCQRAGFVQGLWENPDPAEVYDFLAECRRKKGYALPMDFAGVARLLTGLRDKCRVFTVRDDGILICLTIAIRVNSRIIYNFCPADDLSYRTYSPTVMLTSALYEYAQAEGVELIDLGISLDHLGNEKASLIRFKENIGGIESVKLTFEKVFS